MSVINSYFARTQFYIKRLTHRNLEIGITADTLHVVRFGDAKAFGKFLYSLGSIYY